MAIDTRPALTDLDDSALEALLTTLGQSSWRVRQLRDAQRQPFVKQLSDIRQFSPALSAQLAEKLRFLAVDVVSVAEADGGLTQKLLLRLRDGQTIETVVIETPKTARHKRRGAVCVSTQVGCAVGCPFCSTGQLGLRRSCTVGEVVDQVRAANAVLHAAGRDTATHVVYMGMGEPLAAYSTTVGSIRKLSAMGISPRRMTVSTSGVVPAIDRLAQEELPVTLAVSLHAGNDALRNTLVPMNRAHNIASVIAAATRYFDTTGRRVTLEWCLISGVNDRIEDAAELRNVARQTGAHVNVIPMNDIPGSPWHASPRNQMDAFLRALGDVPWTVRDTRGQEGIAACGQLRADLEQRRFVQPDGSLGKPVRVTRNVS